MISKILIPILLFLSNTAFADKLNLKPLFSKPQLSNDDLQILAKLNNDDSTNFYQMLYELRERFTRSKDSNAISKVTWAILKYDETNTLDLDRSSLLDMMLSPEFADYNEGIVNDLRYIKYYDNLMIGNFRFDEFRNAFLESALKTENPLIRLENLAKVINEHLLRGIKSKELAQHINELLGKVKYNVAELQPMDIRFINEVALMMDSLDRVDETKKIEETLAQYCGISQARAYCTLFYYNYGFGFLYSETEDGPLQGLTYMQKARKLALEINDQQNLALTNYGLVLAYTETKNFPKAIEFGHLAVKGYKELNVADWAASALLKLSIAYFNNNENTKSLQAGEEALDLCPAEFKSDLMAMHHHLSKVYEVEENYLKSMQHLKKFIKLEKETAKKELEENYLELRNKSLKKQNQLQSEQILLLKKFRFVSGLAISLFLISCVATFFAFRAKRKIGKQSLVIAMQKKSLEEVLDNINLGIITLDHKLEVQAESSAWAFRYFDLREKDSITTFLAKLDASDDKKEATIRVLELSMDSDELQWETNKNILLSEAHFGNRRIHLDYSPVYKDDLIVEIICNVEDVTERYEAEQAIKKADERTERIFQKARKIISSGRGGKSFVRGMDAFLKDIESCIHDEMNDLVEVQKQIHTIKGNARITKFDDVADLAHNLEDAIAEKDDSRINELSQKLVSDMNEYQNALEFFDDQRLNDKESIFDMMGQIHFDLKERLQRHNLLLNFIRVSDYAGPVNPIIREVIIHGITNAIDHGFILPKKAGRSISPVELDICLEIEEKRITLTIRDNGIGIDWEKVKKIASEKSFLPKADRPLTDVLFLEGVSTAETITNTSGRGQGMGSVKKVVEEHDGDVKLLDNDRRQGSMLIASFRQ